MKAEKILKKVLSVLMCMVWTMIFMSLGVSGEATGNEYDLRVLTFEDEGNDTYWSYLIASDQYSDPMLYGGASTEGDAYKWYDKGNTELMHILPFNYGSYNFWGGGHAISNYASTDFEYYGDYMSQLTVFKDAPWEEGILLREGGGNNGSDNFAIHFGYKDESGVNNTENLPALSFADGKARVIDHMYVNVTTYALNCYLNGNGFTEGLGEDGCVKIVANGYVGDEKTKSAEFDLVNLSEGIFVTNWTKWDLSALGEVSKVEFNMAGSSDNGYGFSQPAYFAYDDVAVRFERPSVSQINFVKGLTDNTYDYDFMVSAPEITSGKAITAIYTQDRLVGIDIKEITNGINNVKGNVLTNGAPTRYQIIVWSDCDKMKPLCGATNGDIN